VVASVRKDRSVTRVAIIGSGPSAIYALHGLIDAASPLSVTVFERNDTPGLGTPYDPKTNSPEMLANIASIEIPEIDGSLLSYLQRCDVEQLNTIGVDPARLGEREFYPRIALGAFFADRLAHLTEKAAASGHRVEILAGCNVVDVMSDNMLRIVFRQSDGQLQDRDFDRVVLATGHSIGDEDGLPTAYSTDHRECRTIGILGSSLSAIDLAVAIANDRGQFVDGVYALSEETQPFSIAMLSRGGRLPEADFFCPLPAEPCSDFTQERVAEAIEQAIPGSKLDTAFMLFAAALTAADPAYAAQIHLGELSADTFADAYFADRDRGDPFEWAASNLAEAERNHRDKVTVPWRYTILRCHEAFGSAVPNFNREEVARFNKGMKRVFADNYAAIPPLSIKRLLALHQAGVLRIEKLSGDYRMSLADGGFRINSAGNVMEFDQIYDARGQTSSTDEDLPFPSLRLLIAANRLAEGKGPISIKVENDYRVKSGINLTANIWCLAIPFLLSEQPFVQGLTSCWDMGRAAAQGIIASLNSPSPHTSLDDLREQVLETDPVYVETTVVLVPAAAGSVAAQ